MVLESQNKYDLQWAAFSTIARTWLYSRDASYLTRDTGGSSGGEFITSERQHLKEPERENRELCHSNDILRQACAYFAQAEFNHLWKKITPLVDTLRDEDGA